MPNKSAKFSSDYLSKEQMHAAILALPGVLQTLLGEHKIIASYGWGTNIHVDLTYKPMREDTRWIQYLIEDSIEHGIVLPGGSDFLFEVPEGRLELLFCHESDIHLDGSDDELLQRFMATEPFSGYHWSTREDVERMMT
jgi:hypothetical protein